MIQPEDVLRHYVQRHNQGVTRGNFEGLMEMFRDDAVLEIQGRRSWSGKAAIERAFREQPPTDELVALAFRFQPPGTLEAAPRTGRPARRQPAFRDRGRVHRTIADHLTRGAPNYSRTELGVPRAVTSFHVALARLGVARLLRGSARARPRAQRGGDGAGASAALQAAPGCRSRRARRKRRTGCRQPSALPGGRAPAAVATATAHPLGAACYELHLASGRDAAHSRARRLSAPVLPSWTGA